MEPILEIRHLAVSFTQYDKGLQKRRLETIRDLSLQVRPGEVAAIVGASGSGKSLLAHAILGILPYNSHMEGEILYDGEPLTRERQEKLRGYMEGRFGSGFDYAYRFPGMNRVLQAAGRVIRTATDRGVVLLLDNRYLTGGYRVLYPPHWNGAQVVSTPEELLKREADFWRGV